jgi:hypothetical protein
MRLKHWPFLLMAMVVGLVWVPAAPAQSGHTINVFVYEAGPNKQKKMSPGAKVELVLTAQCLDTRIPLRGVTDEHGRIVFYGVPLRSDGTVYAAKVSVNGVMRDFFAFKPVKNRTHYYLLTLPCKVMRTCHRWRR